MRSTSTRSLFLNLFRYLRLSELVLKKARPSASSRRKGVLRLPPEGRASFGFLREDSPLAGWRLSEGSERPSGSFTSGASFGKLHLWREYAGRIRASFRRKPSFFQKEKDALPEGREEARDLRASFRKRVAASPLAEE